MQRRNVATNLGSVRTATVNKTMRGISRIAVDRAGSRGGQQLGISGSTLWNWVRFPGSVTGSVSDGPQSGCSTRAVREGEPELRRANRDPAVDRGVLWRSSSALAKPGGYIHQQRDPFWVEPICTVMSQVGPQIDPANYYFLKKRPPSTRAVTDACEMRIMAICKANYQV